MSNPHSNRRGFLKSAGMAAVSLWTAARRAAGGRVFADDIPSTPKDVGQTPTSRPIDSASLLSAGEAVFRATRTGCVVQWVPKSNVEARLLAGPAADELALVRQTTSAEPSAVELSASKSGGLVFFQMQYRRPGDSAWVVRPVQRVQCQRSPGETFRVALLADSHVYAARETPAHMLNIEKTNQRVLADKPDFVVFLGDEAGVHFIQDKPGFMNQQRAFERWELWRNTFAPLLEALPSYMVLGNHEGEAGYYQQRTERGVQAYLQRWGTVARKRYCLNPLARTYPEGGENDKWRGDPASPATGGADEGNASPLQNYYAWTWGDALFVVLDVNRYTRPGGKEPSKKKQWTLGSGQMRWLEAVLTNSRAKWKFVIIHHLVGGSAWDVTGTIRHGKFHVYGRGGARYARVGEQARITDLMQRTGAQCVLYGHDHVFAHQQAEGIHFVCCGRPSSLSPGWWSNPGWREAYGDSEKRNPNDFYGAVGYTRLTVSPGFAELEYIRTGTDRDGKENVTTAVGDVVDSFRIEA